VSDLHTINPDVLMLGSAANSASVRAMSTLHGRISLDSLRRAHTATREARMALVRLDRAIKAEIEAAEAKAA